MSKSLVIAGWIMLLVGMLAYPVLFLLGMSYVDKGYGLHPDICFILGVAMCTCQALLAHAIDD